MFYQSQNIESKVNKTVVLDRMSTLRFRKNGMIDRSYFNVISLVDVSSSIVCELNHIVTYNNTGMSSLLGNCIGKQGQKRFSVWSVRGRSQQANGRPGSRSRGTPTCDITQQ
jgi:hypothetical protein